MDLSVLVINYNCATDVAACLATATEAIGPGLEWEFLVWDNASKNPEKIEAALYGSRATLHLSKENLGFGRANNALSRLAQGRILVILNPDTLLKPGSLAGLCSYLESHPEVGGVGPLLEFPDGTLQGSWAFPSTLFWEFCETHYLQGWYRQRAWIKAWKYGTSPWSVGFTSGACLCMKADTFASLGGFDADFFMNYEDVDICDRVRKTGKEIHVLPWIKITHCESVTQKQNWKNFASNRLIGRWIYYGKRYQGASKLIARFLWWEGVLWKSAWAFLFFRGSDRTKLSGYIHAAFCVLSGNLP